GTPGPEGRAFDPRRRFGLGCRGDRSEQAVGLVVRARGEVEGAGRTGTGVVAEADPPQPVDHDGVVVAVFQVATAVPAMLAGPVGIDPAVAEVPDEERATEAAPAVRSPGESPRRVEVATRGDPTEERAVRGEHAHEAATLAGDLVLSIRILLRVGHEDHA